MTTETEATTKRVKGGGVHMHMLCGAKHFKGGHTHIGRVGWGGGKAKKGREA